MAVSTSRYANGPAPELVALVVLFVSGVPSHICNHTQMLPRFLNLVVRCRSLSITRLTSVPLQQAAMNSR
jgi:hypothetical protein